MTEKDFITVLGPIAALDAQHRLDAGQAIRLFDWRRCYRRRNTFHCVDNKQCECLRVELPTQTQAKSSGALGTPERNHTCPACNGAGCLQVSAPTGPGSLAILVWTCPGCSGSKERTFKRKPAVRRWEA